MQPKLELDDRKAVVLIGIVRYAMYALKAADGRPLWVESGQSYELVARQPPFYGGNAALATARNERPYLMNSRPTCTASTFLPMKSALRTAVPQ